MGRTPPIWNPLPGPQTQAYHSPADELFYGGAAGGGKSDLGLGLAATAHRNALILRREFPRTRALIERSRQIFNRDNMSRGKDSYNESLHIWRLSDNRVVEFGALQYEKDKLAYQGRPHDLYVWDEVTEFLESQFRFVNAWNRTTIPGQRCRVLATGNPPTDAEGEWVIRYWAPWLDPQHPRPARPGELRWFTTLDGEDVEVENGRPFSHKGEEITPRSRTFIPARVQDNPYLIETGYLATLNALPEPLRSKMLYGSFEAVIADDPWQVIPTEWVTAAQARWSSTQPDVTLRAVGVDVARGGQDKTVIARLYGTWFAESLIYPGSATPDGATTAQYVLQAVDQVDTPVCIDVIGYGASAYDHLCATRLKQVVAINNAGASRATDKSGRFGFTNLRAQSYWRLREALDPASGEAIALPPSRTLRVDLCAPRYRLVGGKIGIEPKADIIARTGRSPDEGDAVVMAWHGAQSMGGFWVF